VCGGVWVEVCGCVLEVGVGGGVWGGGWGGEGGVLGCVGVCRWGGRWGGGGVLLLGAGGGLVCGLWVVLGEDGMGCVGVLGLLSCVREGGVLGVDLVGWGGMCAVCSGEGW